MDDELSRVNATSNTYLYYDWLLRSDETFLMASGYKDSLFFYTFTDKSWTEPDYKGIKFNTENDKWTRIAQTKHNFKGRFRLFELEDELYFLTNKDTLIYKYEGDSLRKVASLQRNRRKPLYYLVDKDEQKLYFMYADGITFFDPASEKRLFVLRKEDELYEAMLKIIKAPRKK